MSSEWTTSSLLDHYEVRSGLSKPAKDFGSGHPFLTFKDVFYNYFTPESLGDFVQSTEKEREACSVLRGDVFLTRTSETMHELGMSCVALRDYENATFNGFCKRLRPKPESELLPEYVGYYLRSPKFRQSMLAMSTMSTRASLNNEMIGRLEISFPSRQLQVQISEVLKSLDDRITLLRETNTTLEAIAQALFKSWFVDFDPVHAKQQGRAPEGMDAQTAALFPDSFEESELGMVPKGWSVDWLSNMMDFKEGPGIRNWQYTNSDEGTRFINIRCIQDGDLSLESANRIHDDEANGKYSHFHLNEWDIVVSTSGTLGRSAIVRKEHLPLMLNTSVIRFRPINGVTEFGFLFNYLNSSEFLYKLESMASGSVQKNFGPMHLKQIKIIKPNFDVVKAYENISKPIFEKILENRSTAQNLTLTRDTLLPRLISGQLRLPEAQALVEDAVDA